jgi:wyosine [tRNA(Phe)-imidazoG37] synthetase (radical SAM superfamily)
MFTLIEEIKKLEQIEAMLDKASKGDERSLLLAIEPIGNDDSATKAFIELLQLARPDESENPDSTFYSERVTSVRNMTRLAAFHKFVKACDAYYADCLEDIQ